MTDKAKKEVEAHMRGFEVSKYKRGPDWKGYEVYKPVYNYVKKDGCYPAIGYPLVVLVKGDEVRVSTVAESLEYLDFENSMNK